MDSKYSIFDKNSQSNGSFGLKRKFSYGSNGLHTQNGHIAKKMHLQNPVKNGASPGTTIVTNENSINGGDKSQNIHLQRKQLPVFGVKLS